MTGGADGQEKKKRSVSREFHLIPGAAVLLLKVFSRLFVDLTDWRLIDRWMNAVTPVEATPVLRAEDVPPRQPEKVKKEKHNPQSPVLSYCSARFLHTRRISSLMVIHSEWWMALESSLHYWVLEGGKNALTRVTRDIYWFSIHSGIYLRVRSDSDWATSLALAVIE